MRIRSFTCLLYLLVIGTTGLFAQRTQAFSAGIGTTYYYGDLTDKFNNSLVKPAGSIAYTKYVLPTLAFRVGASIGEIGASDAQAIDNGRKVRNLHFKSILAELSGVLVYELLRDKNFGNEWQGKPHFTPYVFGGVALFYMNPQARYEGQWYDLQPLGTEGQNIGNGNGPYSLIQFSAPFGAGINMRLSERTGISFEVGYRTTATDYMDDVSTVYPDLEQLAQTNGPIAAALSNRTLDGSGGPGSKRGGFSSNDSYFFTMVSISYYLSRYASRD